MPRFTYESGHLGKLHLTPQGFGVSDSAGATLSFILDPWSAHLGPVVSSSWTRGQLIFAVHFLIPEARHCVPARSWTTLACHPVSAHPLRALLPTSLEITPFP